MSIRRMLVLTAAVLAMGGLVAACGSNDTTSESDRISVSDPWTRITTPTATTGAVYMSLESPDEDKLTKASVPASIAGKAEIHETIGGDEAGGMDQGDNSMDEMDNMEQGGEMDDTMSGGMMGMREISSLTLPAGEEVTLEPGGYHIMLMDLAGPISEGDTVPVTLTFEKAGEITVEAEARED